MIPMRPAGPGVQTGFGMPRPGIDPRISPTPMQPGIGQAPISQPRFAGTGQIGGQPIADPRFSGPHIMGSFKKGGKVKKSGLYRLHAGEVVVPLSELARAK